MDRSNAVEPRSARDWVASGAALLALAACAALAPIQSRLWNGAGVSTWIDGVVAAIAPSAALPTAASAMDQPPPEYFAFGRPFLFVYLALLIATRRNPPLAPSWSRTALATLLAIAGCGDFLAYWVSAAAGPAIRALGFWRIESPAIALLLAVSSYAGARSLRRSQVRPAVAWSFALCVPLALGATAALRYMPHGPLLPFALATATASLVSAPTSRSVERRRASLPRRLGRGALATSIALVLLLAWWLPYRPVVVAGDLPPPGPYALPAGVAGLRLHVFNTGANRMSSLLVGSERPWRPAPAFVIEHPREGLVVFDLGLSPEVAEKGEAALGVPMRWLFESRGRADATLDVQMRAAGLDPGHVRWVIVSHLHVDHLGAARAFTAATFAGGEGASGHRFDDGFAPAWRQVDFSRGRPWPPFAESVDFFGDGSLRLLRGGGHTAEDVMALLALPEGPVLLAGDAVVHRQWLRSDDVQRIASDPARAAAVRNQVRALVDAAPALVLIPGHDLGELPAGRGDLVLHHPEWFDPRAWPIDAM